MSHYFDASPDALSRPRTVELFLPDQRVTLHTDRGVFAPDGVDAGTKLLLLSAPHPAPDDEGDLLDLGCGYGPVAVVLALRAPKATVWAVDVNERARALTEANAEAAGVAGRVRVVAPDGVPDDVRFAGIWSNPPIRIGKAALHDLLSAWLQRRADESRAWLVVQKHLGSDSLQQWLTSSGWPTTRLTSRAGYRILEVA
jgi:16S rRNA (guanine1207-N2)-methyltransferase